MISHPDSNDDSFVLLERWVREVPHIPVSILSNPTTLDYDDLVRMCDLGANTFTAALGAVTPEIFDRARGVDSPHKWGKYWHTLEWAAEIYGPEKFGARLICGMGETEQEILEAALKIRDRGGHNHMLAFFPERGSLMEDQEPVPPDQWRRVQLARFLIDYAGGHVSRMRFDASGRLTDFGMDRDALEALVDSGKPFQTSDCPGHDNDISACNRPYGDSMPTDIRSFPFALGARDVALVRRQLRGDDVGTCEEP